MAKKSSPTSLTAIAILFVTATSVKALLSLWHICTTSAPDFAFYYGQTKTLLPPPSTLLFLPLRILPFSVMQCIWVVLSFILLIDSIRRLCIRLGMASPLPIAVMSSFAFLFFPTQFTLGMGQVNLIALWLLIVGSDYLDMHSWWGSVFFSMAILLKPELVLFLIPLVIRSRWKEILWVTLIGAVFSNVALFLWGNSIYTSYLQTFQSAFSSASGFSIYYNQSLTGLFSRAGIHSPLMYLGLVLSILSLFISKIQNKKLLLSHALWYFIPVFLLIEPIAWQHHFVFLIPTFLIVLTKVKTPFQKLLLFCSYALIGWNFVHPEILATMPLGWLVLSHVTIGTGILLGLILHL